jgi:ribosomal protein S27AE
MTNYKNVRCWKCDTNILVASHDLAERNYCQSCAWDKILYDNRTDELLHD